MIDDIRNTYLFTTNQGDKIEVRAWFEEEAIIEFQEDHQRIGPDYYKPTIFVKVEKVV
jgi:hypothetical protein